MELCIISQIGIFVLPYMICLNIKLMIIITIQDTTIQTFQTDRVRKSLLYKGPHDWFNLDAAVKAATSIQAFGKNFSVLNLHPIKFINIQAEVCVSL